MLCYSHNNRIPSINSFTIHISVQKKSNLLRVETYDKGLYLDLCYSLLLHKPSPIRGDEISKENRS